MLLSHKIEKENRLTNMGECFVNLKGQKKWKSEIIDNQ